MLDKTLNTVIMPFRLKLKRTGRYILSYKNSFLIRVQLLDNSIMECTLTMESTGTDCLNVVAQKLELRETKYFGLYYINKQSKIRWVELDRPLKKQIDKNAQELTLYFGVLYYVANIDSLEQEISRYLFYLQLKNNIIDGLLHCSKEEAVDLASYILQAEFDDHDPARHVIGYFSDYILFPEVLTPDEEHLGSLTAQAIELHQRHRGLRPADAEYNFILKAIHLEGFSEALHPAKNSFGNDVSVGCSFVGIVIKSSQPGMRTVKQVCHDWTSVGYISHTKLTLSIEVTRDDASLSLYQFNMEDADTAKYLCKFCEVQRKFYLQNKESTRKLPLESARSLIRRPTLRRNPEMGGEEIEQPVLTVQTSPDYVPSQDNNQVFNAEHYYSSQTSLDHAYVSQTSLNHAPPAEPGYSNGFGGSVYSSPSINSLSQSHVGRPSPTSSNLSINSSHQRGISRGLPHYRPSPDYDVALRQRRRYSSYLESNNPNVIRQSANQQHPSTSVPQPSLKPRPHSMIYSQQELVHQVAHGPPYAHYPQQHPPLYYRRSQPPLDSSQGHIPNRMHWDTSHESLSPPGGSQVADTRLMVPVEGKDLRAMTGSTPELTIQQQQGRPIFVSEIQLHRQFQNPPSDYQAAGSTSTPDLTQHKQNVSASNPDLHLGYNQPPRPHRPLPPVESYSEEGYNNQQMLVRLVNNQMPTSSDKVRMRTDPKQHKQQRPTSSSFDMLDGRNVQRQTPQQNVQAYLEEVGQLHRDTSQDYQPYKRPVAGSRERLLQQEIYEHQQYANQQPRKAPVHGHHGSGHERAPQHYDAYPNYQKQNAAPYHHAPAPSTATMVVHSDDEGEATSDYLLSQQLQDQALEQVRISRSQEYLDTDQNRSHTDAVKKLAGTSQQRNVSDYVKNVGEPVTSQYRPPPPYPDSFVPPQVPANSSIDETTEVPQVQSTQESPPAVQRGPPPPYHTPSPSVVGQDIVETYGEDEEECEGNEARSDSFQHARRSTIRKMPPLKFAAMNGLNVSQRSNSPVKGEPDERVLNLEAKVEDGHVLTEYDEITRTRLGDYELESMSLRDRVKEVVPYRDCRVLISPSSDNPNGYINASHVKALVADEEWHYIACQTPLEGFQDEMWDMVWRNNVSIIVLITQEAENGKTRCARYWPNSEGDQDIPNAVFGNYKVMCRFDSGAPSDGEPCSRITRNLVLERAGSSDKRTVWMLQYVSWPDTGVPKETDDFLGFMKELDSVRRLAEDSNESPLPSPVVVQCASGSGRTGVLILAELMVQCLERNQDVSVAEMLTHVRQQRIHFVQTFSQYNFVYKLLIAFLSKSRLI